MATQTLYLWFPGTASEALLFYRGVFGGELALHTYADFGRTDGPAEALAHGMLTGAVTLCACDAAPGEPTLSMSGASVALLGVAAPEELTRWFAELAEGGAVIDALQERGWNACDGQVVDRFGVRWLIGYELPTTH